MSYIVRSVRLLRNSCTHNQPLVQSTSKSWASNIFKITGSLRGVSTSNKHSSFHRLYKSLNPIKPVSNKTTSKTNRQLWTICLGSAASFGALSSVRLSKLSAQCEYKAKKQPASRLIGITDESIEPEPQFPWKEFLKVLLPELWYLLGAVVSAFAVAIVNIQIPILLGDVVNVVSRFTADTPGNFIDEIKEPAVKLITMYSIQGGLTFLYITLLSSVGERIANRMRKMLFEKIITQDIAFFDAHKTGEIINRLTSDVQDFKSSFKLCISQGLRALTQTLGCAVSLYLISPKLTGLLVVVVPSIIAFGSMIGSLLRGMSRRAQAQVSKATGVADEAVGNVRTVRAFAMENKEIELYGKELDVSASLNERLGIGIGLFQGLSNVALNGIVLGTLYAGGYLMAQNELTAGQLMSFMVATQTVQRSLAQMSMLFGQAVRGVSSGARVFEYMMLDSKMPVTGGHVIPYHTMHGDLEFKNIRFSYPTRKNQEVLKDFSLKVPAGRMVALCGLSGGGKSTVAALLERFYDVDSGQITIDGHDIKAIDPSWLRGRAIGFINQEPVLFATSVMENIRYGKPDATDEEVRKAAELANAHHFISEFPHGYDTVLGERGVTVSGGQKQRIAIARALIKNPYILVLDEATSALDAESERVVQQALDKVSKGRTVVVIAHRLSTIRDADIIAVVSNGQIAEMGSHDELRKRRGLYWQLIRQQESEDTKKRAGFFGQG